MSKESNGEHQVDIDTIEKLMEAMKDKEMTRLSLKEENGFTIELERSPDFQVEQYAQPAQPMSAAPVERKEAPKPEKQPEKAEETGQYITSPMVGTFYASPSPEDPSFVNVGDTVQEDTVVCIIEAMKVMNEVRAGKSGKIVEICLDNAHAVEFGTKLFRIG